MNPQSAIAKGKELENFICDELKSSGVDARARRTPGSGNGLLKADIDTDIGWAIEAKNTRNAALPEWWRQSLRQSVGDNRPEVVWHPPQQPLSESVVTIRFADFIGLLKKTKEPTLVNPDRTALYKLHRLRTALKDVEKELWPTG
jgi:hypothetical protein